MSKMNTCERCGGVIQSIREDGAYVEANEFIEVENKERYFSVEVTDEVRKIIREAFGESWEDLSPADRRVIRSDLNGWEAYDRGLCLPRDWHIYPEVKERINDSSSPFSRDDLTEDDYKPSRKTWVDDILELDLKKEYHNDRVEIKQAGVELLFEGVEEVDVEIMKPRTVHETCVEESDDRIW